MRNSQPPHPTALTSTPALGPRARPRHQPVPVQPARVGIERLGDLHLGPQQPHAAPDARTKDAAAPRCGSRGVEPQRAAHSRHHEPRRAHHCVGPSVSARSLVREKCLGLHDTLSRAFPLAPDSICFLPPCFPAQARPSFNATRAAASGLRRWRGIPKTYVALSQRRGSFLQSPGRPAPSPSSAQT